ncbi:MAG TPA: outer membrane beta-barrel protein [Cytophagaceae bacterium]|jgi:hypothetical protein|nr:outer membrane beta-barrel protein [Cytophagaceae bacterium]
MRIISYILLFVCFNITVNAQAIKQKMPDNTSIDTTAKFRNELFRKGNVSFGLKAGYTQSNIYGSDITYIFADKKTNNLPSFHAGVLVNSMVGNFFWLKHELLLVQKGAGVTLHDSINGNYSSTLKMLSLDLFPFSPAFHYKGFQIYAGPYISGLLNASIIRKDTLGNYFKDKSIYGSGSQFENKSKYLQKIDFGINAGIEYQFPFGLFFGVKYKQGFTDIFQYANSYTFNDPKNTNIKIYNRSFLFSVGYSLVKLKK